ncbi:nucleotidyltransferase [Paenibacillus baekrokdamisoli]|uniref:Nucleotidyltransferase n=1 Tax=Paenibacillus baekrokdamisoli TaxID=1712516 RepID=A0A3G9J8G1_9BACL|nr:sugar phosphate nucleotidyltransferase [Paenibacillus baekrokdamisoli]MBB3072728.1 mannose-1-phosphate guanylyltransferase/phosphomannomutase [Paenibacillus baekrokdamisoli]BBH20118.1 nucleotidyltransferase [Paenibacillus baekrokdamisoli]
MKAVIMAGGKGTRLRPLTSNTPKPMVPLLDRPVMAYTIELLKKYGITDIAVTVQYLPEVIRQYFGDGSDYGVRLHYVEEEYPLGTAGSVKNAEDFLDETFLVISGDALTDFNLGKAVAYHREKQAVATLVLTQVENPLEFGVIMTDEAGEIIRFLEKPCWGEVFSDTVNTGIYVLEPEVFRYFDHGKPFDFSKDLFPLLMKDKRSLYGYVAEGYWSDIGNLLQYRQAQFDMLDLKVEVNVTGREIAPQVWVGEGVRIDPNVTLTGPAFIGRHSVIEAGVSLNGYTVVGESSRIARSASLERSVLWKSNFIDQNAEIKGGTLCNKVVVRSGAIVSEEAVVGDGCHIGVKSFVQPGIKIFPGKTVESHTTLNHSLIWGERVTNQLFGQLGVKGICNVEMTTNFASRLALAYGTILPVDTTIGISHDETPFTAIIADSFASSMHASGIHTFPFGAVTTPVSRHAAYHLDCVGGIHIRMLPGEEDNQLVIEFLDPSGLPISKDMERKIENAYFQDDSRLIAVSEVGKRKDCPDVRKLYQEHLLELAGSNTKGYTVVLEYHYPNLGSIIPVLADSLGWRIIQLNQVTKTPSELASWVKSAGADLGLQLDENGRLAVLVTDEGEIVREEMLIVLLVMIRLLNSDVTTLHVPVNAPNIIETLASKYGKQVIRTKADLRSIMAGCQDRGFYVYGDGLYTLIHMLRIMKARQMPLSQMIGAIPEFALLREQVDCPWTEKGSVMRFLMEQTKGEQVELIDGIKIIHDEGWTLILPDSEEPVFQVFANGVNEQTAKQLASTYTSMIENYRRRATV